MKTQHTGDATLRWRCRRGMLELDMLLIPFFDKAYPGLSATEKKLFATLLEAPDPELYNWLIGTDQPANHALFPIIETIKRHAQTPH